MQEWSEVNWSFTNRKVGEDFFFLLVTRKSVVRLALESTCCEDSRGQELGQLGVFTDRGYREKERNCGLFIVKHSKIDENSVALFTLNTTHFDTWILV